jgi:hypothetical protein
MNGYMNKEDLENALDKPERLEALYRSDKTSFKKTLEELYEANPEHLLLKTWHLRFMPESERIKWGDKVDWVVIGLMIIISGTLAKLPDFFHLNPDDFFPRYLTFIYFPFLFIYVAWKKQVPLAKGLVVGLIGILGGIYMTYLPGNLEESDTFFLAAVHFPLFFWTVIGFAYIEGDFNKSHLNSRYLLFNGEFLVLSVILGLSGVLFLLISVSLFNTIGINTELYVEQYGIYGLSAIPLVACHLLFANPSLLDKISPIVARLFSPIALVMLLLYLTTSLIIQANPYDDRSYLLILNGMLVAVMALILFSASDASFQPRMKSQLWILLLLTIVSMVIDLIALSAILYRIAEWGFTPNRLVVLGSNLLILLHMIVVFRKLLNSVREEGSNHEVSKAVGSFLPVYSAWFVVVAILFPLLFSFK